MNVTQQVINTEQSYGGAPKANPEYYSTNKTLDYAKGSNSLINYPYQDETAFNTLLWKYKSTETLDPVYVNVHTFEAYKKGEETLQLTQQNLIEGHDWSYVYNINDLMLYHGYKENTEPKKILNYINENLPS